MGQNLNLKVLAEAVETEPQVQLLRDNGCDYIQGYYYSKLVTVNEVLPFLQNRAASIVPLIATPPRPSKVVVNTAVNNVAAL